MCFINEGRDINEVEGEAIKYGIFFGWDEMDFYKRWRDSSFYIRRSLSAFLHLVRASEAQGHFWQDACCWWICKVRFTDGCRGWTCQHKVNGRDSLAAHQSLGRIPKMLHVKWILRLLLIRSHSEMIIINSFKVFGASSAVAKNLYHDEQRAW